MFMETVLIYVYRDFHNMSSYWAHDHFMHSEDAEQLSILCIDILSTYAVLSVFCFLQGSD